MRINLDDIVAIANYEVLIAAGISKKTIDDNKLIGETFIVDNINLDKRLSHGPYSEGSTVYNGRYIPIKALKHAELYDGDKIQNSENVFYIPRKK